MEVELWNAQEELCCPPPTSVTPFASPGMPLNAPASPCIKQYLANDAPQTPYDDHEVKYNYNTRLVSPHLRVINVLSSASSLATPTLAPHGKIFGLDIFNRKAMLSQGNRTMPL